MKDSHRWHGTLTVQRYSDIKSLSMPNNIFINHPFDKWITVIRCMTKEEKFIIVCFEDVHAHCYCPSLVHMLFIKYACATSCISSAHTESELNKILAQMTFALTWCASIFVGCSVTPTFFQQISSFSDSFHYTKKQKICMWEVLIISQFTIQIGSNWYMVGIQVCVT